MEMMPLGTQYNWFGKQKSNEWSSISIKSSLARCNHLMVTIRPNVIMIYGGRNNVNKLSDGFLFDTEKQKIVKTLSAGDSKFESASSNSCCLTEHGTVIAAVSIEAARYIQ